MYYHLPSEVHLDVFKCLNFNQLFSVKQVNSYFSSFIDKYEGELARKFFKHIGPIELDGFYYYKIVGRGQHYKIIDLKELERHVVHFPLDSELKKMWQFAVDRQFGLYVYPGNWIRSKIYHVLHLTDESHHLLLKLPPFPKNIEELQIIRFCLIQLFKCGFEEVNVKFASFNPFMIKLLFEDDKTIFTKFQTEWAGSDLNKLF